MLAFKVIFPPWNRTFVYVNYSHFLFFFKFSGMDDASFAKLHSKVYLKGFTTGSIIYERDTPSDTAYIILHGSVSVRYFL